jgi:hypothetical protein
MRAEAQSDDVDADLVAHFLFTDILRVIGHFSDMRSRLGVTSARACGKRTGALTGLRNAVMHRPATCRGRIGRSPDSSTSTRFSGISSGA